MKYRLNLRRKVKRNIENREKIIKKGSGETRTVSLYSFFWVSEPKWWCRTVAYWQYSNSKSGHHCRDLGKSARITDLARGGQQELEGRNPSDNAVAWPRGGLGFWILHLRACGVVACHTSNHYTED